MFAGFKFRWARFNY